MRTVPGRLRPTASGLPPRLLFVTTVASTMQAFLLPYARHLRDLGWRVDALAAGIEDSDACRAAFDRVHEAPWTRSIAHAGNAMALAKVRAIVATGAYDLVHVHTPIAATVTRLALRHRSDHGGSPRVVYTAHGFHFRDGHATVPTLLMRQVEQLAGRWTDALVVINDEDAKLARRHRVVDPGRLVVMPGIGLDVAHYDARARMQPQARAVRDELGIPADAPLFLSVAEFRPRKRHVDMLRAMTRLDDLDAHLALVGAGPLQDEVRALAQELGISPRVHVVGRRQDVRPHLCAADALLLVSTREGLPRSVMEAMAAGTPVVGSDTAGTRDLLRDGRGMLVPVGDHVRLAAAMRAVIEQPEATARRVQRARTFIDDFDIRTLLVLHERLYRQVLDDRLSGRRADAWGGPALEGALP